MEKPNILFINPDMYSHYQSKIKVAVNRLPSLTMAVLAGSLLDYNVKIVDMALFSSYSPLIKIVKEFSPHYICLTSLTPTFNKVLTIIQLLKQHTNAKIILGGVHASSFPERSLEESKADIVVKGEGDLILKRIIEEKDLSKIQGICYKENGKIIRTPDQSYIQDLDILPYPAWHLLEIKKYKCPRLLSKRNPVGPIETSRGCVYGCVYCSKCINGRTFRMKSPKRVVEEIKFMLNAGFKEISISDDGFSTDMERAKKICKLIIDEKIKFIWSLQARADRIDEELIKLFKEAGVYRIAYGIESGNQEVLDRIKKGTTIEQIRKAIGLTKKYNIETLGFFMFGLPGDTEKTMQDTINFAKSLKLDTCKASITIPFPGSPLYDELNQAGAIKAKDWSLWSQQSQEEIYKHPNLEWETIYSYYSEFYKQTLYTPSFIFKRIKNGLLNGQILWDIYYLLKTIGKSF